MPFQPGQSGNPKGKPPKEKEFAAMLRIALKEAHEEGKDRLRAVADALVTKAAQGDVQAIKEVADRLDGKAAQSVQVGGDPENPLVHEVRRSIVPHTGNPDR